VIAAIIGVVVTARRARQYRRGIVA